MGMGQKSDSWEKDRELLPRRASEPLLGEYASMDSGKKKKKHSWKPEPQALTFGKWCAIQSPLAQRAYPLF